MKHLCSRLCVAFLLLCCLLGCGKITRSVDISDASSAENTAIVSDTSATVEETVAAAKDFSKIYLGMVGVAGQAQETTVCPASFTYNTANTFSTCAADTYAFWSYKTTTKNNGLMQETVDSKFRYIDSRTQAPFDHYITAADLPYVSWIEEIDNISGFNRDGLCVYRVQYHAKITRSGEKYIFSALGTDSWFEYYAYRDASKKAIALPIKNFSFTMDEKGTSVVGTVACAQDNVSVTVTLNVQPGSINHSAQFAYAGKTMAKIRFSNDGIVYTDYYVGKDTRKYHYTEVRTLLGGLEDYATVHVADGNYEAFVLDGTTQILPHRLKQFAILGDTRHGAKFKNGCQFKYISGLRLRDISIAPNIMDCSNTDIAI